MAVANAFTITLLLPFVFQLVYYAMLNLASITAGQYGSPLRWPTTVTSNTNYSHQIQITHIKYKILTSKTRLNGQRSQNENYVQFSLGLDPTATLFLHVVLSSGCFAATAEEMSTIATFVATAGKVS